MVLSVLRLVSFPWMNGRCGSLGVDTIGSDDCDASFSKQYVRYSLDVESLTSLQDLRELRLYFYLNSNKITIVFFNFLH